ncbi:hypothetical protein ACVWYH_009743 [Bradyrhizobium sp. GM24.11]
MTRPSPEDRANTQVLDFLHTYLSHSPMRRDDVIGLWQSYRGLGLPNAHFVKEFTCGKPDTFAQRLWEMLLGRHLSAQGYTLTSPDHGPDFRFVHQGLVVWVEAVSPSPRGLPDHWMRWPEPGKVEANDTPHEQILLRWTAAFKEKATKLIGYRRDGIVREGDAYVIAISGAQLGALTLEHGVSQLPYAVETVFPVGPIQFSVDITTSKISDPRVSTRFGIKNANGAPVPLTPFVDPAFSGVSAVMGYSGDRSRDPNIPLYVAHNPFAQVRVPRSWLGSAAQDWWAEPVGAAGEEMDLMHEEGKHAPDQREKTHVP